ncbi:hypothetical protein ACMD2_23220 [Ananas comosus]|uniref:Uncharacterized protein n=1 Tax=Ananas comosus TaxID=4615 RepID=A0A199VQV6_ANACO|nr:hypothetical protein ACMD2_23220 [Ananas comosus]
MDHNEMKQARIRRAMIMRGKKMKTSYPCENYVNTSNTYFPPQIRVGKHIIQDKNVLESLSWNANKDVEFSMLDKDLKDGANTRGPNHLGFCANHIVDEDIDVDVDEEESQYNLDATDYWNLGDPTYACEFCGALFWYEESSSRSSDEFDTTIVNELKSMLDECNCLAKSFRMVRDRFVVEEYQDLKLRLLRKRGTDGRRYNLPTSSEVAALIVGDIEKNTVETDIVVETQTGLL